jgi:serine/threonine-protein kinase
VRLQLDRILSSDLFVNSERLCRFLRWTVEHALQGEEDALKEYALGRDVFDRGEHFDPRTDSIVRVEARRLRTKLASYYAAEDAGNPVITIRKGRYVPTFGWKESGELAGPPIVPPPDKPPLDTRTVAVLPFLNLSAEPDLEFLCQGIAEEVLNQVASLPGIRVVARGSALRFQLGEMDAAEIGERLGAGVLVEGTVRRAGERLRVSARIIDAATGRYLWTRTFNRDLNDIFKIQDEIAKAVAAEVVGETSAYRETLRSTVVPDYRAYTLYLQGRYAMRALTGQGFHAALEFFDEAVALTPEYAPFHAAIAEACNWLITFGLGNPADLGATCRCASREALRLDPYCEQALVTLATTISTIDWSWREGLKLFERVRELQPNYITAYLQEALCHAQVGDSAAAIAMAMKALKLDPLSVRAHSSLGYHYHLAREHNTALTWFQRALELGPAVRHTYVGVGDALLALGRAEEAIAAYRKSNEDPGLTKRRGELAGALAAAGHIDEARVIIHELEALGAVPGLVLAYASFDPERALEWLEKACADHWAGILFLKLDPRFDAVRADPRFTAVLARMNLL